jgi:uncharacterized protein YecT (DUF1311 family)
VGWCCWRRCRLGRPLARRAWISYRDKFCAFQSGETVGGSIHPPIETGCLDEKTTAELTRQLSCKEGDPFCVH